jgi:hypothetical protein
VGFVAETECDIQMLVKYCNHSLIHLLNFYPFFRPIIPFLQQIPPEVLLATARQDPLAAQDQLRVERAPTPATKNMLSGESANI